MYCHILAPAWVQDVHGDFTNQEEEECTQLQLAIQSVEINDEDGDVFSWPWSSSGQYTVHSQIHLQAAEC
jgi:hypothetical protein